MIKGGRFKKTGTISYERSHSRLLGYLRSMLGCDIIVAHYWRVRLARRAGPRRTESAVSSQLFTYGGGKGVSKARMMHRFGLFISAKQDRDLLSRHLGVNQCCSVAKFVLFLRF